MQTIYISPSLFLASGGKLNSNYLYLHKVVSDENFVFPVGKTIELLASNCFVYAVGSWRLKYGWKEDDPSFSAVITKVKYK